MMDSPTEHQADSLKPRPTRKGLYILPSLFTAANIAAGYYAISQAILGTAGDPWHFDHAAKAIGFAILFDGLDGRIARLTNTTSAFGRELDSLADVIAFGIAPAILAWLWGFRSLPVHGRFGPAEQSHPVGCDCYVCVPHGGSRTPGALQYSDQPAAFQSRTPRQEVFRGNAYSGRRRSSGSIGPLHAGQSAARVVDVDWLGRSSSSCLPFSWSARGVSIASKS